MPKSTPKSSASTTCPADMRDGGKVALGNKQAPATMRDAGKVALGNKQAPAEFRS